MLVLEHLGALHPVEQWLVLVLAFGPLVLLAVTIRVARRRQDRSSSLGSEHDAHESLRSPGGR